MEGNICNFSILMYILVFFLQKSLKICKKTIFFDGIFIFSSLDAEYEQTFTHVTNGWLSTNPAVYVLSKTDSWVINELKIVFNEK